MLVKRILAALLSLILAAGVAAQSSWPTPAQPPVGGPVPVVPQQSEVPQAAVSCTVKVWCTDSKGSGHGSGVILYQELGETMILTCRHVADDTVSLVVEYRGTKAPARKVKVSQTADLAIIACKLPIRPVLAELAGGDPSAGTRCYQAGWGGGQWNRRSGSVNSYLASRSPILVARVGIVPGDSGSGLWDERGQLIGCVFGIPVDKAGREQWGWCFATPVSEIRKFLGSASVEVQPAVPQLPSDWQRITDKVSEFGKRLDGVEQRIKSLKPCPCGPQTAPVPDAEPQPPNKIETGVSILTTLLPYLLGGTATGGTLSLVWAGLKVGRWLLSKRKPAAAPAGCFDTTLPVQSPPRPMTNHEFVTVPTPDGRTDALEWALKKVVQDYPGAIGVVQRIESLASQRYSGEKVNARS